MEINFAVPGHPYPHMHTSTQRRRRLERSQERGEEMTYHGGRGSPCSKLETNDPKDLVSWTRRCRACSRTL